MDLFFSSVISHVITPSIHVRQTGEGEGEVGSREMADLFRDVMARFAAGVSHRPALVAWLQRDTKLMPRVYQGVCVRGAPAVPTRHAHAARQNPAQQSGIIVPNLPDVYGQGN